MQVKDYFPRELSFLNVPKKMGHESLESPSAKIFKDFLWLLNNIQGHTLQNYMLNIVHTI